MHRASSRQQLWAHTAAWRRSGVRAALVPTMGNLHAGHLELVKAAKQHADRVIASIYVNPTQFGAGEDFGRYPRTLESDCAWLDRAGCDLVFAPDDSAMYPRGLDDALRVRAAPSLAGKLEGQCRPGHFDGVVTVVARLFNLVSPDVAVFGEKDYQQLLVIRQMVEDLGYPIQIVAVPTMRDEFGLALSSRNGYLDDDGLRRARQLNAVLAAAAERLRAGEADSQRVEREAGTQLEQHGFRIDYVAVRRAVDLAPPMAGDTNLRVLAAVWCGDTRLIDNAAV